MTLKSFMTSFDMGHEYLDTVRRNLRSELIHKNHLVFFKKFKTQAEQAYTFQSSYNDHEIQLT